MSEEYNVSNYFYIQSKDRLPGETSSDFRVINQTFGNCSAFELSLVQIPYTFYPINSNNNTLIFNPNASGNVTAVIPQGSYTATSFISALQTAMNAVSGGPTYTAAISLTTGQLTITQGTGNFVIVNSKSTIYPIIGYSNVDTSSANAQTSPYPVNLSGTDYIDINSTELTKHDTRSLDTNYQSGRKVIRIPIKDYQWGQTIQYKPRFHMMNHKPETGDLIDIQLQDMYGYTVNLNNRDWFMKLKYHTDKPHRKTIRAGNHYDHFSNHSILANKN
jgi:hypothetical protein